MTPRVFNSLVAALIRIGLLLALVILLMAENAQAQRVDAQRVNAQRVNVASKHSTSLPGAA